MSDAPVLMERDGAVVTLTLNRPDARNAMSPELTDAFTGAIQAVAADREVRALVVTGAGTAFCAGGDLSWIEPGPGAAVPPIREKMREFYPKFLAVRTLDMPTIAAINGPAIGAGLCLAMACDIRVAAARASFTTAFARLGMHPGMGATYLLTRLVGTARAAELLFTSRSVSAEEAERIGLVNAVVPAERLLEEARALAGRIAESAPLPVRMIKRAIYLAERTDLETMLEYEGLAQPITMATSDLIEGLAALKERRTPNFRGE